MIGVKGQYAFSFSVGPLKDFINQGDLESFKLIEEAGNVLPTFELTFKTKVERILSYLNEGNDLDLRFGLDVEGNDVAQVALSLSKVEVARLSASERRISAVGTLSKTGYLLTPRVRVLPTTSAAAAIRNVVGAHFNPKQIKGLSTSEDSQIWLQPNISDKRFVQELVLHLKLTDSFPLVGITSQGEFLLKSFKELGSTYKWNFVPGEGDRTKDFHYLGDYLYTSNTGFLNGLFGYGRKKAVLDLESGLTETASADAAAVLALSNTLSRRASIEQRYAEVGVRNENMDPEYWQTALNNLVHWAVFSSHKVQIWVPNTYFGVSILDLAQFKERASEDSAQTSEYLTGLYLVTKVVRTVSAKTFATCVELSRESLNSPKGDLR